ncbi:acyl-CoA dehydrogenase family protein [Sphingomonas sp. MMS24-JH45]
MATDKQVMFRNSARRWVAQDHVKDSDPEAQSSQFAELGWLMIGLPENAGGLGGDAYDVAIVAEGFGRGLVRAPFVEIAAVAARVLLTLAHARVADIATGASRPLLAHDKLAARGDPSWLETVATPNANGWSLTGRKTGLVGLSLADTLLISARIGDADHDVALFEIPVADAPLRRFMGFDDRAMAELV